MGYGRLFIFELALGRITIDCQTIIECPETSRNVGCMYGEQGARIKVLHRNDFATLLAGLSDAGSPHVVDISAGLGGPSGTPSMPTYTTSQRKRKVDMRSSEENRDDPTGLIPPYA